MTNMRYGKLHSFHFTLFSQKIQSCSLLLCFQAVTSLHSPCYTGQLRQVVGRYRGIVISSPPLALWPNPNPLSISALWPNLLSFSYAIFWKKKTILYVYKKELITYWMQESHWTVEFFLFICFWQNKNAHCTKSSDQHPHKILKFKNSIQI